MLGCFVPSLHAVERATASGIVAAAGGHNEARLVLAAMLEGGYGTSDSAPKPGRALYHRLMAAASGDPMARLTMGAATVLGNDAFLSGADAGSAVGSPTSRLPNARCALALHYFYHSATTAYALSSPTLARATSLARAQGTRTMIWAA